MKYNAEMGSGAMMYIQSFVKIRSGTHKFIDGGYTYRQKAYFHFSK
jgi:hypothetical protein